MDRLELSQLHKAIDAAIEAKSILEDFDFEAIDFRDSIESLETVIDRLYSELPR